MLISSFQERSVKEGSSQLTEVGASGALCKPRWCPTQDASMVWSRLCVKEADVEAMDQEPGKWDVNRRLCCYSKLG